MSRGLKIGLFAAVLLLASVFVWILPGKESPRKQKGPQRYFSTNWKPAYRPFEKTPRDLFFIHSLLEKHLDKGKQVKVVSDSTDLDSVLNIRQAKSYFFIGNNFGLKSEELDSLLKEVDAIGSDLFISSNELTDNLYPAFFESYSSIFDYSEEVRVYTSKGSFQLINLFQNDTIACNWKALDKYVTKGNHKVLSSFMELPEMIEISHGEGRILLQLNPSMFFNYQIKRNDGFRYASFVLDQIDPEKEVYLLEIARLSDEYGSFDEEEGVPDGLADTSYLKLIFETPTLLKALLLSLLSLLLFVLFRSKRMRPIVEVLPKKKETSLAFAETISSIYFAKHNPYAMLQLQRKNLYSAVRRHFFIELSKRNGTVELELLAEKSNQSVEKIATLLNLFETTEVSRVDDQWLLRASKEKRKFYQETGILNEALQSRLRVADLRVNRSLPQAFLLLIMGGILVIVGLYLLIQAHGGGILLWPPGILLIVAGLWWLNKPVLEIRENRITRTKIFSKKRSYLLNDLISVRTATNEMVLVFKNKDKLVINYRETDVHSRKLLVRYFSTISGEL